MQGRREVSTLGGGGCRHVLTNFSEDFDQVVKMNQVFWFLAILINVSEKSYS